jgi:hypothetical protein
VDFRNQLIDSLLHMSKDIARSKKRRVSHISQDAEILPVSHYQKVKTGDRRQYVNCKGLRFQDRPQKRVVLGAIAANNQRATKRVISFWACKQCNVYLYRKGSC